MRKFIVGKSVRAVILALGALIVFSAQAEEKPSWEFKIADSEVAAFEAAQFHEKEDAWLLTFRMRVKSLKLVKPISELEFEGFDASEEVVWEKSHTIRRTDFEAAFGGGRSQFVRVFLKDVPSEVTLVRLTYGVDEESESE